jgi:osmoprotectant transport system permease protein
MRVVKVGLAAGAVTILFNLPGVWEGALRALFPAQTQVSYPLATLPSMAAEHLVLVGASGLVTLMVGVGVGVAVTRPWGRPFLPLVSDMTSLGQTFPPIAVLALMVPILGTFGFWPTLIALVLYGLLPVVRNTIAGLDGLPADVLDAARGMGMRPWQVLTRVEVPLSVRVILAGVRTSTVINVGTATIGAAFAAGGLGAPIISGLVNQNPAYVLEGAAAAGMLAGVLDYALGQLEAALVPPGLAAGADMAP